MSRCIEVNYLTVQPQKLIVFLTQNLCVDTLLHNLKTEDNPS